MVEGHSRDNERKPVGAISWVSRSNSYQGRCCTRLIRQPMSRCSTNELYPYFVLPPWCIKPPRIVLDLCYLSSNISVYEQFFMEIRDNHRYYFPVYTDGSRNTELISAVFASLNGTD